MTNLARRCVLFAAAGLALGLTGCIVAPAPYGGPAYYAPPVIIGGGWGWGGGGGGGHWRH